MTWASVLGLLVLKHAVLAHVVDFGYSASRRSNYRFWVPSTVFHCLAEGVGTVVVLNSFLTMETALPLLLVEVLGLVTCTVAERRAPMRSLVWWHLSCESAMLGLYLLATGFLVLCD